MRLFLLLCVVVAACSCGSRQVEPAAAPIGEQDAPDAMAIGDDHPEPEEL